jgi:RNA polymerase sigma-70 factor (ECF subfamily)
VSQDYPKTVEEARARYHDDLVKYIQGLTGDQELAERLAEEIWQSIGAGRERYDPTRRPRAKYEAWLFALAVRRAIESMVKSHHDALVRFLYMLTGDWGGAEDLAQDIWHLIFAGRRRYDAQRGAGYRTFLFWLARQQFWQEIRRRRRRAEVPLDPGTPDEEGEGAHERPDERAPDPFPEAVRREERDLVRWTIEALPERDREVLVLYYIEGLGCEQIGMIMGRPKGTVMRWLAEARAAFVREMPKARAESARDALIRGQPPDRLGDAIAGLPEDLGEVARLHYIEGLTAEEIVERVDLPVESVRERLGVARGVLAAILCDQAT